MAANPLFVSVQSLGQLNPRLELFDPTGLLVASGTVSGDGRNEFIEYTPLVTGDYRIRITAEDVTTGEYLQVVIRSE